MNETPQSIRAAHSGITAALAAAQAEMGPALKSAVNPHLKNRYADLSSVTEACLPALNRHGIAVYHVHAADAGGDGTVRTVFAHEGGETVETSIPLMLGQRTMQGLGSAITYARRYGLMMLAGIAPEDDDGNAASAPAQHQRQSARPAPATAEREEPPFDAVAAAERLCAILTAAPDEAGLNAAWAAEADARRRIHSADADAYERVKLAAANRKASLAAVTLDDSVPF